jgi:hypothetical protein
MHGVQNRLDYCFIPHRCVDHYVVEGAGGPVGVEVVFDKGYAFEIDGIDEFFGIRLLVAILPQAAQLFGARRVEENVKSVRLFAQEEGRAAADYNGITFLGDSWRDLFHQRDHAVGIEGLIAQRRTTLVAAAPESFGQAVETAVHALIAAHDGGAVDVGEASNLFGEKPVPEPPTQAAGEFSGDGAAAAAVLSLDGDEAKHGYF